MTFYERLLRCVRKQFMEKSKSGSSLGLVVIIGSALVIWVMAIMPFMTTSGTMAVNTQAMQDDYLGARSSIEFAKSELNKIVGTEVPYTFAVIREDDGTFSAMPKKNGVITNTEYQACIAEDLDDKKDVPESGDAGKKVAAICAVTVNTEQTNQYDITITAYADGKSNLSYTVAYTLNGSLLINPESYKKSQALPLSDFVLVDGKLGTNEVWKSDIEGPTDTSFTETLLSWSMSQDDTYANSGEYPAVFKMTAQAAGEGNLEEAIIEETLTDQQWIRPYASTKDDGDKKEGAMWLEISGSTVKTYLLAGGNKVDITENCVFYYNGKESSTLPINTGIYKISVDYTGTGEYSTAEGAVNILPVKGVILGSHQIGGKKYDASGCSIESVSYSKDGKTVSVKLKEISGALYGYTQNADGSEIAWVGTNKIDGLNNDRAWYFYCYCPANLVGGIYYAASDVVYAGMMYPFKAVSELEDGAEYMVLSQSENGSSYAMQANDKTLNSYNVTNKLKYNGKLNSGVLFEIPDSSLVWKMEKNSDSNSSTWRFTMDTDHDSAGKPDKYVAMTQSKSGVIFWYYYSYLLSVSDSYNGDCEFNLDFDNSTVYRSFSEGYEKTKRYISISSGGCGIAESSQKVYFVKIPQAGTTNVAAPVSIADQELNLEIAYDDAANSLSGAAHLVYSATSDTVYPDYLYVNGNEWYSGVKLNAGQYNLIGSKSGYYGSFGTLTVTQTQLPADMTMTVTQDAADELKVTVTGANWHENGGIRYFGYKDASEGDAAEFHWFTSEEDSFTFRLDYGVYIFAIAESGTNNYVPTGYVQSDVFEIKATEVLLTQEDSTKFLYALDSADADNVKVTWFELPDGITPKKITMAYGIPTAEGGINWSHTYSSEVRFYGAVIRGTAFDSLDNVLQLPQPMGITNENGHFSSMLTASAMYFMGDGASINTYGNDIYLKTDLIVLGQPVTGGGRVILNPYSTGDGEPGDTLAFFVNNVEKDGTVIFEAKNFYRIPAGTDINNVTSANALAMKCVDDDGNGTVGTEFASTVKYYFRNNVYPKINLDIAYASQEQMLGIVSGETIGWTNDGVLSGNDANSNVKYAVCAYVTEVSGEVDYRANRVLIAAKAADHTRTLTVPANLKFTTRYLSVDADTIIQGSDSVKFELYNLAQDRDFIQDISDALGITNYSSKTLQMDFERFTNIFSGGTVTAIEPKICRYENGTDLFAHASDFKELLVTYTTDDVKNLFVSGWSGTVKIVDRYMALTCEDGTGSMEISAISNCCLDVYANYVYIDPSVDKISFSNLKLFSAPDFRISSQESGYTTEEYLGLFKSNSAESYNGTLLYFADAVEISYRNLLSTKKVEVQRGFYYISATDSGTTLTELADNPANYKIEESALSGYSVYIDPVTGSMSNAYVDTGIMDNDSASLGGFSGGTVR